MPRNYRINHIASVALAILALAGLTAAVQGQPQSIPASFNEELYGAAQKEMICLCGCKSILKDCPHVNCDYAIPAREKIRKMISQGMGKEQILQEFVREKGEQALAAPVREGFNILGYILPFIAILTAGYGVSILAARWARRKPGASSGSGIPEKPIGQAPPAAGGELAAKLKKELEEFDT